MPLWDEFLGILKGAADVLTAPLRGAVGGVATTGAKLGGPSVFKGNPELAAQAGLAAESGTRKSLKDAGLLTYDQATAKVVDPVLYVAQKADETQPNPRTKFYEQVSTASNPRRGVRKKRHGPLTNASAKGHCRCDRRR